MNSFIGFWRWLFPRPSKAELVRIAKRHALLKRTIHLRAVQIAEERRKKRKTSDLVERNISDRNEMLRLEKQLGEWVA